MRDIKPADNDCTAATKGLPDIALKRLNTDSEQGRRGGYTTAAEEQQMRGFFKEEERLMRSQIVTRQSDRQTSASQLAAVLELRNQSCNSSFPFHPPPLLLRLCCPTPTLRYYVDRQR